MPILFYYFYFIFELFVFIYIYIIYLFYLFRCCSLYRPFLHFIIFNFCYLFNYLFWLVSFYRPFRPYTFFVYHSAYIIYLFGIFYRPIFSILFSIILWYFKCNFVCFCLILLIFSSFFFTRQFLKALWHTVFTILHTWTHQMNVVSNLFYYLMYIHFLLYAYKMYFVHIKYIVLT